jgi:hypothetical protein
MKGLLGRQGAKPEGMESVMLKPGFFTRNTSSIAKKSAAGTAIRRPVIAARTIRKSE